jgi:hypothetical protein
MNANAQPLIVSSTVVSMGEVSFALSLCTNQGSLANLFDAYRVLQLVVRFVPQSVPAAGSVYPPLLTVVDRDSGISATPAQLRQYDTLQETPYGEFCERVLTPLSVIPIWNGTSFSNAAAPVPFTWCDMANVNTTFYGVKYGIEACPTGLAAWTIEMEAVMQFRDIK